MLRLLLFILILCTAYIHTASQPIATATWRNHICNSNLRQIIDAPDEVICISEYSFFTYTKSDASLTFYDKTTGLSDWRIQYAAYDPITDNIIIAYKNSNLDFIKNNVVINKPDIKNKTLSSTKTINSIKIYNAIAYMCTDFGIVLYDLNKHEFKDTYIIGESASYIKINDIAIWRDSIYAATSNGVKVATLNSPELFNYNEWHQNLIITNGEIEKLVVHDDRLFIVKEDTIYAYDGLTFSSFHVENNYRFSSLHSTDDGLIFTASLYIGSSYTDDMVKLLYDDGTQELISYTWGYKSQDAIAINGDYYIADAVGLFITDGAISFRPWYANFPFPYAYWLTYQDNKIWMAPNGHIGNYLPTGFNYYTGYDWYNYNEYNTVGLSNKYDFTSIAINKNNKQIAAGSYINGVYTLNTDNTYTWYDETNSSLQKNTVDNNIYFIADVLYDDDGNLWVANAGANQPLSVRNNNGIWKSFTLGAGATDRTIRKLMMDYYGRLWLLTRFGGLIVYDPGEDIMITTDDQWAKIDNSKGIPSGIIYSMCEDINGDIWVGTESGIAVMRCNYDIFNNCDADLIRTSLDGIGSYLFENVAISAITIDGANRKWVGTNDGVYLISADGTQELLHFTAETSPLLDNKVNSIAINHMTGEVFISCDNGVSSYRSDATAGSLEELDLKIFPNPFTINKDQMITIQQLVINAYVKITDISGALVYETTANGGTVAWNGKNYLGQDVASGVYLVFSSSADGNLKKVGKFAIIQ